MEHVINRIIEIEKAARAIVAEAKARGDAGPLAAEKAVNELRAKYMAKAEAHIAELLAGESEDAQEIASEILEKQREKIRRMEQILAENGEKWAREIRDRILAGDDV